MKIKYFLQDEPKKLVQNILGELDKNESNMRFNKHLAESVAQRAFRDYVWEMADERTKEIFTESF